MFPVPLSILRISAQDLANCQKQAAMVPPSALPSHSRPQPLPQTNLRHCLCTWWTRPPKFWQKSKEKVKVASADIFQSRLPGTTSIHRPCLKLSRATSSSRSSNIYHVTRHTHLPRPPCRATVRHTADAVPTTSLVIPTLILVQLGRRERSVQLTFPKRRSVAIRFKPDPPGPFRTTAYGNSSSARQGFLLIDRLARLSHAECT